MAAMPWTRGLCLRGTLRLVTKSSLGQNRVSNASDRRVDDDVRRRGRESHRRGFGSVVRRASRALASKVDIPSKHVFVPPEGNRVNERDLWRILDMITVNKGNTLVITGAGVSTESGIPDYRSPEGSYSKGHKPLTHQEFVRKVHLRKRYWARSLLGWKYFDSVSPCYSHYALAELERSGYISGIITQNVDRLHKRVGSSNLIELHGHNDEVKCLNCGYTRPRREYQLLLEDVNSDWMERHFSTSDNVDIRADGDAHLENDDFVGFEVPNCEECGTGVMMPRVVFFGGSIPQEVKDRAMEMVVKSDGILVFGSSCQVASVYRLGKAAADKGTKVAMVNIGPTRLDPLLDIKLEARCGRALKEICRNLEISVAEGSNKAHASS